MPGSGGSPGLRRGRGKNQATPVGLTPLPREPFLSQAVSQRDHEDEEEVTDDGTRWAEVPGAVTPEVGSDTDTEVPPSVTQICHKTQILQSLRLAGTTSRHLGQVIPPRPPPTPNTHRSDKGPSDTLVLL